MKKIAGLLCFLSIAFASYSQTGDISGKVLDENGDPVGLAKVALWDTTGKALGRDTISDIEGNYVFTPLKPGKYNLRFSFAGYNTVLVQKIPVTGGKTTFVDGKLKLVGNGQTLEEIILYKIPLIDPMKRTETYTLPGN